MSPRAVLGLHRSPEVPVKTLEDIVVQHLDEQAMIGLDTLVALLPEYSWSQIFHAIDRLARRRRITLRRHRSEYTLFATDYAA
jgi:hypothetical protein